MSYANPTPLRLGMTGTFAHRQFQVLGRVVMGIEEDGETYFWNEFNLQTSQGESATLVFECDEAGGHWRLFTLFDPPFPITAADAASKRVGDSLNLDGTDVRVTLIEESRVYHIEGQAPEGVEVGDLARYFNAESGNKMLVVSWTGEEVECYHGLDLSFGEVSSAFNLPANAGAAFSPLAAAADETDVSRQRLIAGLLIGLAVLALGVGGYSLYRKSISANAPLLTVAAPAIKPGVTGRLDGHPYKVEQHAVIEVAEVGCRWQEHEYQLADNNGNQALLVYGLKRGGKEWFLLTPFQPLDSWTPLKAAGLRVGDVANLDGYSSTVTGLFQATVRQFEGAEAADRTNASLRYGFIAQSGSLTLLVRWTQDQLTCFRGKPLPAKDVATAFP